jgi:hypothetical protein
MVHNIKPAVNWCLRAGHRGRPQQNKGATRMNEHTISIKPTREEHARVTAYMLAGHAGISPDYFGSYWELTSKQEDSLFATWNKLEAMNVGTFDWYSLPKSHKAKLIKSLYLAILNELHKEAN